MRRRLLIVDRYDAPALAALGHSPDAASWDVFLLGRSIPWARWQHGTARPPAWRFVDPSAFVERAAQRAGDFLVKYVHGLPDTPLTGTTLHELLRSAEGSQWWFMEIAEKGPLRGPLVGQLYRLMLAKCVLESAAYEAVHIALQEPELGAILAHGAQHSNVRVDTLPAGNTGAWWDRRPALRFWLHAAVAAGRAAAVKVWARVWGTPPAPTRRSLASFTIYPGWWSRPLTQSAGDRFFSHLSDAGVRDYLTWVDQPLVLWRRPKQAQRVIHSRRLHLLQAILSWRDIASVLSVSRFLRLRRFERHMRASVTARMEGLDVSQLIAAELTRSMTGGEMPLCLLVEQAVRRMAGRDCWSAVLFRTEFQPFESALLRGLQGTAAGIGFLHYPFGAHYLSTRFAPGEVSAHLSQAGSATARPLADGIIACGEVGIAHVTDSGYPRTRCAPCGPQRFGRLVDYLRNPEGRADVRRRLGLPLDQPVFFVTLAIVEADTEALFGALALALQTAAPYRLIVRPHPNRPEGDAPLRAALDALGADRATLMAPGGDIYDYMRAADAMICIGSMIAFEAMALGCMPVVFQNPSTFPALSLAEFEDSLFVARDDEELRDALRAIATGGAADQERRARWARTLTAVLGDILTSLPVQLARALAELEVVIP